MTGPDPRIDALAAAGRRPTPGVLATPDRSPTPPDPYASLTDLADGWRARANDLVVRAEWATNRAGGIEERGRDRVDPDPEALRTSARHNRAMAIALSGAAADLDHTIVFARRHVPGATS